MGYVLVSTAVSFLLGSIPFGFLAVRWVRGVDVRSRGSGNTGTVNVLRVGGPALAAVVLLADAMKGFASVWLGQALAGPTGAGLSGLAAVIGHCWSPFLGLRGGKGVATAAGVLAAASPALLGVAAVAWLLVVATTRYASLGSLLATVVAVAASLAWPPTRALFPYLLPIAVIVFLRHRDNIVRLAHGRELKITDRPGASA